MKLILSLLTLILTSNLYAQDYRQATDAEIAALVPSDVIAKAEVEHQKAKRQMELEALTKLVFNNYKLHENQSEQAPTLEKMSLDLRDYFQNQINLGKSKEDIQMMQNILTLSYLNQEEETTMGQNTAFVAFIDKAGMNLDYSKQASSHIAVEDDKMRISLLVPENFDIEKDLSTFELGDASISCPLDQNDLNITSPMNNNSDLLKLAESTQEKKSKGYLYFSWGYNRSWHANSDVTFRTSEGTFTIRDAHGDDRPSPLKTWEDLVTYVSPAKFSIPQYNIQIGYMFNDKWGIEWGQDHMKWVFDNTRTYQVEGDYDAQVAVVNPNAQHGWDAYHLVDFDEIKQTGDLTWLGFEHTDGYNYVHLGGVYQKNLAKLFNNNLSIDAKFGAGAGLMVSKTKVSMHRDQVWNHVGNDNRFHIAGYGFHGDARLKLTLKDRFYVQATSRGTFIKIDDALVYTNKDAGARFEHTPIASYQFMVQIGYQHKIGGRKKKKTPKKIY